MPTLETTVGVAPLTYARTTAGSYAQIYAGDPVPDGYLDVLDQARLIEEGYLGVLVIEVPDEAIVDPVGPQPGSPEFILNEVGTEPGLAEIALAEEQQRTRPRSRLVAQLQAVIDSGNRS